MQVLEDMDLLHIAVDPSALENNLALLIKMKNPTSAYVKTKPLLRTSRMHIKMQSMDGNVYMVTNYSLPSQYTLHCLPSFLPQNIYGPHGQIHLPSASSWVWPKGNPSRIRGKEGRE